MNYTGNEDLRDAIAALSNDMYEMHRRLSEMVSVYFWNSEGLAVRLAGQILRDAHDRYAEIYRTINELDHHFKD